MSISHQGTALCHLAPVGLLLAATNGMASQEQWSGFRVRFTEWEMERLRPLAQLTSNHPALAHFSAKTMYWLRLAYVSGKPVLPVPQDENEALAQAQATVGDKLEGVFSYHASDTFWPEAYHVRKGVVYTEGFKPQPGKFGSISLRLPRLYANLMLQYQAGKGWAPTRLAQRHFESQLAQAVSDRRLAGGFS